MRPATVPPVFSPSYYATRELEIQVKPEKNMAPDKSFSEMMKKRLAK